MKKVLIVTFYFPPRQSTASVRFSGLAKYLSEFGWEPIFLTAKLPDHDPDPRFRVIQTHYPGDMIGSLANRMGISYTRSLHSRLRRILDSAGKNNFVLAEMIKILRGFIEFPDNQRRWRTFAVETGHDLLQNEKVDVILSSSPPQTAHFIAHELARRHNIPWIGDFRDLWALDYGNIYGVLRRPVDKLIEKAVMRPAGALVSISGPISDTLRNLHEGKKVFTVMNGFDPDSTGAVPLAEKLTMTFTGRIHFKQMDNVPFLFSALRELIDSGAANSELFEIRFFGTQQDWIDRETVKYGLQSIVKQWGELNRDDAVFRQKESQVLLLFSWNDPRETGCMGGKIFEYLAARRPILTIGKFSNNVQADLIRTTRAGVYVSTPESLKQAILDFYGQYLKKREVDYAGIDAEVNKYTHKEMARTFAGVFNEVISRSNTPNG